MKKYILVLLLIIFIIPSIALASWWNPFSWKIFQKKEVVSQVQVEVQKTPEEKISELQKQVDDLKKKTDSASIVPTTKTPVKSISKTPIPKKVEVSSESSWKAIEDYLFPIADGQGLIDFHTTNNELGDYRVYIKENNKWVWRSDGKFNIGLFGGPSYNVSSNGTDTLVCNSKLWTLCPVGQKFNCPETGDASCISSVAKNNNTTTSQPPNTTYCNGKYWNNCTNGKQFYCPASGDAQCNSSSAELEALLKQLISVSNQNSKTTQSNDACLNAYKEMNTGGEMSKLRPQDQTYFLKQRCGTSTPMDDINNKLYQEQRYTECLASHSQYCSFLKPSFY